MREYSKDKLGAIHLSPYVSVDLRDSALRIRQTAFDCALLLPAPQELSRELLDRLSEGATEEEILSLLTGGFTHTGAKTLLEQMMKAGIIE
jgi:hypothetical protein